MLDKFLYNKILYLFLIFIIFIIFGSFLLDGFFPEKIFITKDYLIFLHILSGFIFLYLLDIIIKDNFFDNLQTMSKNLILKSSIFLGLAIFIYLFFDISIINYMIILFIITSITFFLDSRFSFLISLLLLIYVPFYIIIGEKDMAEKISIYVYYFLVIGVGLEIFYNLLEKNNYKKNIIN